MRAWAVRTVTVAPGTGDPLVVLVGVPPTGAVPGCATCTCPHTRRLPYERVMRVPTPSSSTTSTAQASRLRRGDHPAPPPFPVGVFGGPQGGPPGALCFLPGSAAVALPLSHR